MTRVPARFGRFSLVGCLGAFLQVPLIAVLKKYLGFPTVEATAIAVEIVILHNFVWHERFTWSGRTQEGPRQLARRLWRFHAGNGLVSLGGNTVLMFCLVERLKLPAAPAALASIALCSAANFLLADCWVYTSTAAYEAPGQRSNLWFDGCCTASRKTRS